MRLVSGMGAKGTSAMALSQGQTLGLEDVKRLAEMMREAPLLTKLDIRQYRIYYTSSPRLLLHHHHHHHPSSSSPFLCL